MATILAFLLLFSSPGKGFPPGVMTVKHYQVDQTEVLNIHWLEFLYFKKSEVDSVEYAKLLPDSSNYWYTYPEHAFKPLVLITYEQALAYCAWRSEMVSKNFNQKVTYRLPTATEWLEIAEEIRKSAPKQITKDHAQANAVLSKADLPYLLFEVRKPKNRMYHLFDNVTEMTSVKGIAVGLNNHDILKNDLELAASLKQNQAPLRYSKPHVYLGFRCIAEVE